MAAQTYAVHNLDKVLVGRACDRDERAEVSLSNVCGIAVLIPKPKVFELAKRKTDWRDTNWYIGLVGFWREYRRHRMGVLGIAILFGFVVLAIGAPWFVQYSPSPSAKIAPPFLAPEWTSVVDPGAVKSREYAPDPTLSHVYSDTDSLPINEILIHGAASYGTSSSFSGTHHLASGPSDTNYISLTWQHTAGDEPHFVSPVNANPEMPDCEDFVYFTQAFEWPYERLPNDVNVSFSFGVTLTGDFASNPRGGLMFKVYVWLIDSSGNWRMIYDSYPPYTETVINRRVDLNWFDIIEAWGGMVDKGDGQEDPTDVLTIAFGLAPTQMFETEYENYDGSVTVKFTDVSVFAYGPYFGILGTTDKGADAWSQLVFGTRISLTIGITATLLSTIVGVIVGMTSGYFGGRIDEILMRVVDFLLVIPGLPLMMVLAAFLGPTIQNIILVIAILGWTGTSRLIRSQVMAEKNKAYVESAKAIGASDTYIIYRHILPNVTPILFADITLGVVGAILSESGLSFLGLTDPSQPSWGRMLADAQGSGGFSNGAWWVVVFPGLMITVLSLAFTFVGHTLDQVLNPRLRER
ncbi:MAG: hypothetical protein DRO73_04000 [Candidatus Thorarchaeota archaeon]|nr:MAG: hypothetical protein DRO73_04000 [Candidatus Thorarchaeota archaeon]